LKFGQTTANLQYFKKPQKLNRRQARWLTELQEFHFTIHHIPGKANSKADILSRRAGFDRGVNDNDDEVLLPSILFRQLHHNSTDAQGAIHDLPTTSFQPRIHRARKNLDKSVATALERKEKGWKTLEDGTHTFNDRVYIPNDKKL
jgi:hypothetical protein